MARSSKIYVVFDADMPKPDEGFVAAFTVKHEMVTWVQRYRGANISSGWQLCVIKDGTSDRQLLPLPDECFEEWRPQHGR